MKHMIPGVGWYITIVLISKAYNFIVWEKGNVGAAYIWACKGHEDELWGVIVQGDQKEIRCGFVNSKLHRKITLTILNCGWIIKWPSRGGLFLFSVYFSTVCETSRRRVWESSSLHLSFGPSNNLILVGLHYRVSRVRIPDLFWAII